MIMSLSIKNIALIQELTIELGAGLNILSGETGAGKSIIIDSINFVLGDRADRSLIRYGEQFAKVEVVFSTESLNINNILQENDIECDDYIIVTRTMTESGKGEAKINGKLVNLSTLKRIVSQLIDIHGQHENVSLLNVANHLALLDNYTPTLMPIITEYKTYFVRNKDIKMELDKFSSEKDREQRIDTLKFQIEEIENFKLQEGEEEELISERTKINNFQRIFASLSNAETALSNDGGSLSQLNLAIKELTQLVKFDNIFNEYVERLDAIRIDIRDVHGDIENQLSDAVYDETKLNKIEKRLEGLRSLKRKYGYDYNEINVFLQKAKEELDMLENCEQIIAKLQKERQRNCQELLILADKISELRKKSALRFEQSIYSNLKDLGMSACVFKVDFNFKENVDEFFATGKDDVQFLISPNKGEPLKSLAKIVSGGEMSRLMLALKNITAELDDIGTLVFDEIDSGISGKIATEVACKLYNIAVKRQVIAVTHLPQLTSMADRNYLIEKSVINDKTITNVNYLSESESIKEIMRLSGAVTESITAVENAKEMKVWSNEYKKSRLA